MWKIIKIIIIILINLYINANLSQLARQSVFHIENEGSNPSIRKMHDGVIGQHNSLMSYRFMFKSWSCTINELLLNG